jgi:hypothetical protein
MGGIEKKLNLFNFHQFLMGTILGRDRMIVGFTTTYAISAYHQ